MRVYPRPCNHSQNRKSIYTYLVIRYHIAHPTKSDPAGSNLSVQTDPVPTLSSVMYSLPKSAFPGFPETLRGIIISICLFNPSLGDNALKERVAKISPPAFQFFPDMMNVPAMFIDVRNFLDKNGCNLQQHSLHRITMSLAHNLYDDADEKSAAIDIAKSIQAISDRNPI